MAKNPFLLRGARGKIGNIVLRKSESGTVVSEYVTPSNPQTAGQMRTRIAFGTVAKAGAALAALVGISFQGETSIKGARRRFNALNISKLSKQIKANQFDGVFAPKGMSVLLPNKLIVSDGTIRNATLGTFDNAIVDEPGFNYDTNPGNYVYLPLDTPISAEAVIKSVLGVEPGDQITLVGIRSGYPVELNPEELEILRDGEMVSARVYFKEAGELANIEPIQFAVNDTEEQVKIKLTTVISSSIKEGYGEFWGQLTNLSNFEVDEITEEDGVHVGFKAATVSNINNLVGVFTDPANIMAFGYFRSHLNSAGTQWMFSRCTLVVREPTYDQSTYDNGDYINYGYMYALALSSYLKNSAIESTRYTETGGPNNTLGF